MQTRRDQLQAYRFQNRRALAALVTGRPNVIEPPMRRLTVTTISGIMIAILIAVGFALVGLISHAANTDWKAAGAVIVDEVGAHYVVLNGRLDPVLNYPSAVLAAGQNAHTVTVERSDLNGFPRGPLIGIQGLPDSLPDPGNLVANPWTVCSREEPAPNSTIAARVDLFGGADADAQALSPGSAVLAHGVGTDRDYLLADGKRFEIDPRALTAVVGSQTGSAVPVGDSFLTAIPAGRTLTPPRLPNAGQPAPYRIDHRPVVVGQLIDAGNVFFVVLGSGTAQLTPLEAGLLRAQPVVPPDDLRTSQTSATVEETDAALAFVRHEFAGLPAALPKISEDAHTAGAVCAVYPRDAQSPVFGVPPSLRPDLPDSTTVAESRLAARDNVDSVILPPGSGAIVTSSDYADDRSVKTVYLVTDAGQRYAAASLDTLAGFGYTDTKPVALQSQLLSLIPSGPALDPTTARTQIGN